MNQEYDNEKQVILRKVVSENPKAPALNVSIELNGVKYQAGLWTWKRGDGTPVKDKNGNNMYQGTLDVDDYKPKAKPVAQYNEPMPYDEEIPF